MKSSYFTSETINDKSLEILGKLEKYVGRHKVDFIPEKSALLILDMQKFFLEERSHAYIPSALPIIPKIKSLAEAYKLMGLPIIYTRHLNTGKDAMLMGKWWRDFITEDSDLSEIIPKLIIPDSIVIRKTQYDGFYRTNLEDILREKEIDQLIITGVMSHLCCETTVRSAFVRGFTVFFPIDGTATYNEDFHWATFLNLSHGFAVPVLTEELKNHMESSKSGNQ